MNKIEIIEKIKQEKIISVVRYKDQEKIEKIVESIIEGGINLIEITMTIPNAIEIIKKLENKYKDSNVIIGAGTVVDFQIAKEAIDVGAQFVVSPILNKEIIKVCNELNIVTIPGIATPTEAYEAMKSGAEILKLFPSNIFKPNIIKTLKGPFPEIKLMPTGGINLDNMNEWIDNGAIALGIGGELLKGFNGDNYEEIINTVRLFRKKII
jgi:2-dehydro-3-deoxyphosphogluconate aldolase/(4S)-4-hydroxy-2-oxoglutarate aldolase